MKYTSILVFLVFNVGAFAQSDKINEHLLRYDSSTKASVWQLETKSTLDSGAIAVYTSQEKIKLVTGFKVEKGANFKASIAEYVSPVETFFAFPNPFKDFLQVSFRINFKTNLSLYLMDINGRVLEKIVENESVEKGTLLSKVVLTRNYPAGTYLVTLQINNYKESAKVVKL